MSSSITRWLLRWKRRLRDLPTRLREWPEQKRMLGGGAAGRLGWSAFRYPVGDPRDAPGPVDSLTIPALEYPFVYRQGTSDVQVIRQIFVRREYEFLTRLQDVRTIVDLGANVGAASVFLLSAFPFARVIGVEPAPQNYEMLKSNLAPYGQRAGAVQGAIWPCSAQLELVRGFRDGLDWSIQVKPADCLGITSLRGFTMNELIDAHGLDAIDLLKIDIEGAEKELFQGDTSWLPRVRNLCIELHDQERREIVMRSMQPFQYQLETSGETTFFEGIRPR